LLNLIDNLRRPSRFHEAISLDEEHLELIEAARERLGSDAPIPNGPVLSEYGPVEERLDALIDAVNQNTATTIAAAGGKPPSVQLRPRPETALERVRHQRRMAAHVALTARLMRRTRPG
jgi:hypothetical protein